MMFTGRVVLGPVAQRLGPARVLAVAVAGIPAGAALMTAPGPGLLAVVGLMILGLAAAPVFPLLTLMTPQWADSATGATRMVSLQVAASAAGSAALPAGLGLAIGAVDARILGPVAARPRPGHGHPLRVLVARSRQASAAMHAPPYGRASAVTHPARHCLA